MSDRRIVPAVLIAVVALPACGALAARGGSASVADPRTRPTATGAASAPPSRVEVGTGAGSGTTVEPQPASGSCHYRWMDGDPLPDRRCTPGATDPRVTQDDIGSTICHPGWTAGVRPPERVTAVEKRASAAAYGYAGSFATAEYDHLVPLELGGSPNDPANLWVEPNDNTRASSTFNGKDRLEDTLHADVCAGRVPLTEAQGDIATNWVTAVLRYGG